MNFFQGTYKCCCHWGPSELNCDIGWLIVQCNCSHWNALILVRGIQNLIKNPITYNYNTLCCIIWGQPVFSHMKNAKKPSMSEDFKNSHTSPLPTISNKTQLIFIVSIFKITKKMYGSQILQPKIISKA